MVLSPREDLDRGIDNRRYVRLRSEGAKYRGAPDRNALDEVDLALRIGQPYWEPAAGWGSAGVSAGSSAAGPAPVICRSLSPLLAADNRGDTTEVIIQLRTLETFVSSRKRWFHRRRH